MQLSRRCLAARPRFAKPALPCTTESGVRRQRGRATAQQWPMQARRMASPRCGRGRQQPRASRQRQGWMPCSDIPNPPSVAIALGATFPGSKPQSRSCEAPRKLAEQVCSEGGADGEPCGVQCTRQLLRARQQPRFRPRCKALHRRLGQTRLLPSPHRLLSLPLRGRHGCCGYDESKTNCRARRDCHRPGAWPKLPMNSPAAPARTLGFPKETLAKREGQQPQSVIRAPTIREQRYRPSQALDRAARTQQRRPLTRSQHLLVISRSRQPRRPQLPALLLKHRETAPAERLTRRTTFLLPGLPG
mmetsp:Transcript_17290/g.65486  ORF Transcript_17290/g.65486 Transcript_17290/m.65486 type:complete len:303 (+) Transcript_17290:2578-3486(+)